MKLSAPPPPPPEPNDPAPPAAGETVAAPDQPAGGTPPQKGLSWPAWFAGADFLLTVVVLVLAFLVASFVARNSDVWLHLAAGQRLAAGEYSPGSDPFSFAAADRTWVNHSILFDLGAYLLYGGGGELLVVLKALAVAAAVGLVIALRRPGHSLWPWAGVGLVAVFAIAPYTHLRPVVGSYLLFAVTLYLLFCGKFRPGSWAFPAAVGVTFWVWANVDEWFFLGPLAVALVLVGELVQRALAPAAADAPAGAGTLGSPPDVPALAKALGVGLVACMLNPHHVGVWQLPLELTGARELLPDTRFRQLLLGPLEEDYYASTPMGRANGYTANGLAYAILFVAGGAAVGLAGARLRFAHLLVWVGFALLSLKTVHLIPFVALLAVPLVASQLNALSGRVTLGTWGEPRTRVLLLGSGLGRVVVLILALVSCVRAWPGWMHPPTGNEAYARRVAWGVEPDAGMVRGAEALKAWRAGDHPRLAPEARGMILSLEFANYCAWFAPREKVYANARHRHHRRELDTFTELRKGLGLLEVRAEQQPKLQELNDSLKSLGVEYVVTHSGPGDAPSFRNRAQTTAARKWQVPAQWSPWYLDGRTAVCGWRPEPGAGAPSFDALRLDPVVLAFGPDVKKLPPGETTPVRPPGGWEEAFLRSPRVAPPDADEALGWQAYKRAKAQHAVQFRDRAWDRLFVLGGALAGGWPGVVAERAAEVNLLVAYNGMLPPLPDEESYATPLLSLRAAYRAIADDPDHPDGYLALATALGDPHLPLDEAMRTVWQITALRQCLRRLPSPENYRGGGGTIASPFQVSLGLANLYLGRAREFGPMPVGVPVNHLAFQLLAQPRGRGFLPPASLVGGDGRGRVGRQWVGAIPGVPPNLPPGTKLVVLPLDEAREMLLKARDYFLASPPREAEDLDKGMQALEKEIKAIEDELGRMNNRYEQRKFAGGGQMRLAVQVEAALEYNLVGEALRLLGDEKLDLEKEFGAAGPQVLLSRIALELVLGRQEDAAQYLEAISADAAWQKVMGDEGMRHIILMLKHHKCVMEGDFAEAGKIIEGLEGEYSTRDPLKAERQQFDPKPYVESRYSLEAFADWAQLAAPLSVLGAPTPLDVTARAFAPSVALGAPFLSDRYAGKPGFVELQNSLGRVRQSEGQFYLRRGIFSLFEGDIPAARERFLQTRPSAEQKAEDAKWGLSPRRYAEAERYIELIDRAAARTRKK